MNCLPEESDASTQGVSLTSAVPLNIETEDDVVVPPGLDFLKETDEGMEARNRGIRDGYERMGLILERLDFTPESIKAHIPSDPIETIQPTAQQPEDYAQLVQPAARILRARKQVPHKAKIEVRKFEGEEGLDGR